MMRAPSASELAEFRRLINENRYDFVKLAYLIFGFGEEGPLEDSDPYEWQVEEWRKLSKHLANPLTRYDVYRLGISSGNGAAKTAFGAMTMIMLMYTQRLRCRMTANTLPQMQSIVWPEVDVWCRRARFFDFFFEKLGTAIKSKDEQLGETWRVDAVTWNENNPASISGLHNKGGAVLLIFEEAPGIPAVIYNYAEGAFTETGTIKLFFAFGNSDDPNSKFEQNMTSPLWRTRRIDTRTLKHVDQKFVADVLQECGGNEDHDNFRVRIRGLPRKTAKDSIFNIEDVDAAIERGNDFDVNSIPRSIPRILSCDPAWQGGDETTLWLRIGSYTRLLEKFKLDKTTKQTHQFTFGRLCYWEDHYGADAVFIDQGEGTAIYTLAQMAEKTHWELVNFSSSPNDKGDPKESEYANIRAQMYYEGESFLREGGIITAEKSEDLETIRKQLCWTKGDRHKVTGKKICESKKELKARVGASPDVADGFVLLGARKVLERLPENDRTEGGDRFRIGEGAYRMPDHPTDIYDVPESDYRDLYD